MNKDLNRFIRFSILLYFCLFTFYFPSDHSARGAVLADHNMLDFWVDSKHSRGYIGVILETVFHHIADVTGDGSVVNDVANERAAIDVVVSLSHYILQPSPARPGYRGKLGKGWLKQFTGTIFLETS